MEDQTRSEEAQRAPSPRDFAGNRRVAEDVAAGVRQETADDSADARGNISRQYEEPADVNATVVFEDHRLDRYVWPFAQCRSFDMIKPLIEEIYTLMNDTDHLDQVKNGEYLIKTEDGAVILSSVWKSIVVPSSVIRIELRTLDRRRRKYPRSPPSPDYEYVPRVDVREKPRVDFLVPSHNSGSDSEFEARNGDGKSSLDGSDSELSTLSDDSSFEGPSSPMLEVEEYRAVSTPTDPEGNKLSFRVKTALGGLRPLPGKTPGSQDTETQDSGTPKPTHSTNSEHIRITKAISTQTDGKSVVQVYTLSGPDNDLAHNNTSIDWYHIYSERLDYARFKSVCLEVPGSTARLQKLTQKLLEKVEKEHVEALLDGMFVKPGTVLRGDESDQPDPQSVIFSCVPYFDLQPPIKQSSITGQVNRLFPPRTLMQSYYPYEPVGERDDEQAYRKFGNEHSNMLVHVPNLWMMNIGDGIVVTCGHQPLSKDFVKSIETVPVDVARLQTKEKSGDTAGNIRLIDGKGRQLLFSPKECRSYFQMEQKSREMEDVCYWSRTSTCKSSLQLARKRDDGKMEMVTPRSWNTIIRDGNGLFIDLTSLSTQEAKELESEAAPTEGRLPQSLNSVPPFFQWPHSSKDEESLKKDAISSSVPVCEARTTRCLELADKAMLAEVLQSFTINEVDSTFTSTDFYRSLPEESYESFQANRTSLLPSKATYQDTLESPSQHQIIVQAQNNTMAERIYKFHDILLATMKLYVDDFDKATILRKLWAAMSSVCKTNATIQRYDPTTSDVEDEELPAIGRLHRSRRRVWYVRDVSSDQSIPDPAANDEFKKSIRKCRPCRDQREYDTLQSATEHLQKHLKWAAPSASPKVLPKIHTTSPPSTTGTTRQRHVTKYIQPGAPDVSSMKYTVGETAAQPNLQDWILSGAQKRREDWNWGTMAILAMACEAGQKILDEAKDLIGGVRNEDGAMSELYTLPRALLGSFRQTVVFYLAIERALHITEELYEQKHIPEDSHGVPFTAHGLDVLNKFSNGVLNSLTVARDELCAMARSDEPMDVMSRLSLGPQYLCGWFMRRLLVKPLEKSMAVSDMYREYLSTIQFQVNHRPGKRLLRSINLLQEELMVLLEINRWQTQLVTNYMRVLHDSTYEKDIPSRRGMYPYERQLLTSCLEHLALTREEYADQIRRCGPLSESTKQSLEINEEDHGKAIMIFTIVTIIFLPLSFVTSYLGMNTSDIRDMESRQSLFWTIAIPLTAVTMGSTLFISYNGDELRDSLVAIYRAATGKQNRSISTRGISVAQRKRARNLASSSSSSSTLDHKSLADEAEYMDPHVNDYSYTCKPPIMTDEWETATLAPAMQSNIRTGRATPPDFGSPPRRPVSFYSGRRADVSAPPDYVPGIRHIRPDPLYYVPPAGSYGRSAPRIQQSVPIYNSIHGPPPPPPRERLGRHYDEYPSGRGYIPQDPYTRERITRDMEPQYDWIKPHRGRRGTERYRMRERERVQVRERQARTMPEEY